VKDRVSDAASQVGDAGREVAGDAKEKAHDVAHEAKDRARGLVDQARTEVRSQAQSQQQRLAGGLHTLGDELQQMAEGSQDPGYASEIVQRAGAATEQVAQWFEDREPASVLREVESFARRRPGTFLLLAAGAGLVVGRLLRGMKDAPDEGDRSRADDASRVTRTTGGVQGAHLADTGTGLGTGGTGGYGTSGYDTGGTGGYGTTGSGDLGTGGTGSPGASGGAGLGTTGTGGLGTSGARPVEGVTEDPESPTTGGSGYPPPTFPPTTEPDTGTGTTGGASDVHRP